MKSNPLPGLPTLGDFGHDHDSLIEALQDEELPSYELGVAAVHAEAIEDDILALIQRARHEDLSKPSIRLLFRGIHILGGRRLPSAYRPFVTFLREADQQKLHNLLGDMVTQALPQVLAGLFDGDVEPLQSLIRDEAADEFVRSAAFGAFAFLIFDGRIERDAGRDFLERFERESEAEPETMAWYGWMLAIGLLGLKELEPRVFAAYEEDRIPAWIADKKSFAEIMQAALDEPEDLDRFKAEQLGYIEDILECMQEYAAEPGTATADTAPVDRTVENLAAKMMANKKVRRILLEPDEPVRNPYRHVGRNDPCPCGSGKKFKRCCMPA